MYTYTYIYVYANFICRTTRVSQDSTWNQHSIFTMVFSLSPACYFGNPAPESDQPL